MKPRNSRILRTIRAVRDLQLASAQVEAAAADAHRRRQASAVEESRIGRDRWQSEWERHLGHRRFEPATANYLAGAVRHAADLTVAAEQAEAQAASELAAARAAERVARSLLDLAGDACRRAIRDEGRQRDEIDLRLATERFLALWSGS